MNVRLKLVSRLSFLTAFLLLAVNFYGLTQNLRPLSLSDESLRFKSNDLKLSHEEFSQQVKRLNGESAVDYANRLTSVIADGMAHVHWNKYPAERYNQLVPAWENYILYFMGRYSGIPEYERYHFSNPEKSIERGIGLCGDVSMLMSTLLKKEGIENKIITIPGHVMVEADFNDHKLLFDPDYGVTFSNDLTFYSANPDKFINAYKNIGVFDAAVPPLAKGLVETGAERWNGVEHFITKKYYFEKVSYILKWLIPVFLILVFLKLETRKFSNTLGRDL